LCCWRGYPVPIPVLIPPPSSPDPSPGSLPSQRAALVLGQDPVKQKLKILEVKGKNRAGGSPQVPSNGGARGTTAWLCQGLVALNTTCWDTGCGDGGTEKQQEQCCAFHHFLAFLDDAELWEMLAFSLSPQKPGPGVKTDI